MFHECKLCGKTKDSSEFVKHIKQGPLEPWNLRKCKECSHGEYVSRYLRKDNREAMKTASRNWKSNNKERHAEINSNWYKANKHKARASSKLRYAVRRGVVTKLPCEVCGSDVKVQGHHDSYAVGDELKVRWLCQDHHKRWHVALESSADKSDINNLFNIFVLSAR